MDFLTYSEKLDNIKYYIESNSFATAIALSLKLGVSKRTILRMVDRLRSKGINIIYCNKKKKYFINKIE